MKKVLAVIVSVLFVLSVTGMCFAQAAPAAKPADTKAAPADVDKAKADKAAADKAKADKAKADKAKAKADKKKTRAQKSEKTVEKYKEGQKAPEKQVKP